MKLQKIAICGSVDDGKSTLLGRLMYELGNYTDEKLEEVKKVSKRAGKLELDYSLFTDGLIAEREQGITIDVAHLYMTFENNRIIWADAPGHEQYTRNMVTAASGSKAAILLTDISRPLTEQCKRHLRVLESLKISNILVVVNKMDLVHFDQSLYDIRKREIEDILQEDTRQSIDFVPASAISGTNLIQLDKEYFPNNSLTVLNWIQQLNAAKSGESFYAQVQAAIHLGGDKRLFQTWVYNGTVKVGDTIQIGSENETAEVVQLLKFNQEIEEAAAGESVEIVLDKQIDISRGTEFSLVVEGKTFKKFKADLFNLDDNQVLMSRKTYLLKRGITEAKVRLDSLENDVQLARNEKGSVYLSSSKALMSIPGMSTEANSFILIDESSNNTCAFGIIRE